VRYLTALPPDIIFFGSGGVLDSLETPSITLLYTIYRPDFTQYGLSGDYCVRKCQQFQHNYDRWQELGPAVVVATGASGETSAYKGEPTQGHKELDFSNGRVSEMGINRGWIFSPRALLPW